MKVITQATVGDYLENPTIYNESLKEYFEELKKIEIFYSEQFETHRKFQQRALQ
jgi:hypothetical protein